jgi:hypothetical protein
MEMPEDFESVVYLCRVVERQRWVFFSLAGKQAKHTLAIIHGEIQKISIDIPLPLNMTQLDGKGVDGKLACFSLKVAGQKSDEKRKQVSGLSEVSWVYSVDVTQENLRLIKGT